MRFTQYSGIAEADGADPSYDESGRGNGVGVVGMPVKTKGKEARIYPVRMPDSPLHVGTLCRYQYHEPTSFCAYFLMRRGLTDHFNSRMSIYL